MKKPAFQRAEATLFRLLFDGRSLLQWIPEGICNVGRKKIESRMFFGQAVKRRNPGPWHRRKDGRRTIGVYG